MTLGAMNFPLPMYSGGGLGWGFFRKATRNGHALRWPNPEALQFMYFNYCRIHQTLRVTPAMEVGLAKTAWEIEDLAALVEAEELRAIENGELKRGKCKAKSSD